ncbi:MAG: beta-lactamase family protein [Pirellulaceae bacterium]|nr:beta-lactamase family protein [Pirellulaceae bacterium]
MSTHVVTPPRRSADRGFTRRLSQGRARPPLPCRACRALLVLVLLPLSGVRGEEPEELSAELERLIANTQVPSLAAAAVLDGRIVAAGASGVRKQGESVRVTRDDKYHIGSCTKSMTATLAAMMVAEGKVRWETTVRDVFPVLEIHADYQAATLRQLLAHTAGCPGDVEPRLWSRLWSLPGTPSEQRRHLLAETLKGPPRRKPGTGYEYSNTGVSIAGTMLEQLAGRPFEQLLRERLFQPLELASAGFRAPATNGRLDQPYGHNPRPVDPEPQGDNPAAIAPAGAVHCSILDLARYARFHLGRGPTGLLSAEQLAELHRPEPGADGYALGWQVVQRPWAGGTALTHAGSNTMFYCVIWLAPQRDFAAVAACNLGTREGFAACDAAVAHLIQKYLANRSRPPR